MRIYITGPGWSGKSTLAEKLWKHYGVPVVHLDALMWKDGWIEDPNYGALQNEAIKGSEWIIEWASVSIMKKMKDDVDLVILLNPHPLGNVWRILKRWLLVSISKERRIGLQISGANRLNWAFIHKMARWRTLALPRIRETIVESGLEGRLLEFNSVSQVTEMAIKAIDQRIPLADVGL